MKNKFWVIFGIVIFIVVLVFVSILGIMFIFPGTSILGFEYVQKNEAKQYTYTSQTDVSIDDICAIDLNVSGASAKIVASANEDKLIVIRKVNYSGFALTKDVISTYSAKVVEKNFAESDETLKTFVIEAFEPNGLFDTKNTSIEVVLPKNINFCVVSAKSNGSKVSFSNQSGDDVVNVRDVCLSSTGSNKIFVDKTYGIENFYFSTANGEVVFSTNEQVEAQKISLSTTNGSMNILHGMNVADALEISSTGTPSVSVNSFKGKLKISSNAGTFNFQTIGSGSNSTEVILNLNKAYFVSQYINAFVSLFGNGGDISNSVTIGRLFNPTNQLSQFNVGSGKMFVNQLECDASFNATSGSTIVKNINPNCSVNAYSTSGEISLQYVLSSTSHENTTVKVFTKTGDLNLSKISGFLDVSVLDSSPASKCDISFADVCFDNTTAGRTNTIFAKDRNVNLTYTGSGEVISRIFTTTDVTFEDSAVAFIHSEVEPGDLDYILNNYPAYSHEYRAFYDKPANIIIYAGRGLIFVNTSGQIVARSEG